MGAEAVHASSVWTNGGPCKRPAPLGKFDGCAGPASTAKVMVAAADDTRAVAGTAAGSAAGGALCVLTPGPSPGGVDKLDPSGPRHAVCAVASGGVLGSSCPGRPTGGGTARRPWRRCRWRASCLVRTQPAARPPRSPRSGAAGRSGSELELDQLEDLAVLSGGVAARCSLCACRSRARCQRLARAGSAATAAAARRAWRRRSRPRRVLLFQACSGCTRCAGWPSPTPSPTGAGRRGGRARMPGRRPRPGAGADGAVRASTVDTVLSLHERYVVWERVRSGGGRAASSSCVVRMADCAAFLSPNLTHQIGTRVPTRLPGAS